MRVLMFFRDLWLWDRYRTQILATASLCEEFYVYYWRGTPPPESKVTFIHSLGTGLDMQLDLVYVLSGAWPQLIGTIISTVWRIPLVIRMRGDGAALDSIVKPSLAKRIFKPLIRRLSFAMATLVVPITWHLGDVAYRLGAHQVVDPVPNGVDLDHFKPGPYPDDVVVGYVGRDSPEKNPDFIKKLKERLPDIKFLSASGEVPYADMPAFYNRCSVIILPSLLEGFSNVLLEAYACGRPVISSQEALPEGFIGRSLPLSIEEWAEAILGLHGWDYRSIAERYTWTTHGAKMLAHFHETITEAAAQRSEADPSYSSP